MGYYSDLVVLIPKEHKAIFEDLLTHHKFPNESKIPTNETDIDVEYKFYSLKWYDDFEDVNAITQFLNEIYKAEKLIVPDSHPITTLYRMGEDTYDEEDYFDTAGNNGYYINREIKRI